jgi:hypothetical protein
MDRAMSSTLNSLVAQQCSKLDHYYLNELKLQLTRKKREWLLGEQSTMKSASILQAFLEPLMSM